MVPTSTVIVMDHVSPSFSRSQPSLAGQSSVLQFHFLQLTVKKIPPGLFLCKYNVSYSAPGNQLPIAFKGPTRSVFLSMLPLGSWTVEGLYFLMSCHT